MIKTSIGVVDYHMGNHASVVHSLRGLGYRVRVSDEQDSLREVDILVLPGVGAFPSAMNALRKCNLIDFLIEEVENGKPLIGICLGMELLAESSLEHGFTEGLGLIPGEIKAIENPKWHIGWNTISNPSGDPVFDSSSGETFYFNHAYEYTGPEKYQVCMTNHQRPIVAVIRNKKVVGLQFHPEKSQEPGRILLRKIIEELANA